jgi:hypothetical protein
LALFLLFFLTTLSLQPYLATLESRHRWSPQRDFALWVASVTGPQDAVLSMDEGIFLEHYGRRRVLKHPVTCDPGPMDDFFTEVDRVFKKGVDRRYHMVPLGYKINEDWHSTLLTQKFFREYLWEVKKK